MSSSWNVICPVERAEVGAGCGDLRFGAETSTRAAAVLPESRRDRDPVTAALNVAGPLMRGISTGSSRQHLERNATRGLEATRCPTSPVSCSMSASPFSMRARRMMFEKPGSSVGERMSPLSTVSIRSGSMRLSVPRSDPVKATAPSAAMFVSGGRYCATVARLPCRLTSIAPSPAWSVSGRSPVTVSEASLASTSSFSTASRSSAY